MYESGYHRNDEKAQLMASKVRPMMPVNRALEPYVEYLLVLRQHYF